MNKQELVKVKLQYPISWGKNKDDITELEFARPKGKHIKKLGKDIDMETLLNLAAKVCTNDEVTPLLFDEMDATDCFAITEVIGDFLEGGQKTGKTQ